MLVSNRILSDCLLNKRKQYKIIFIEKNKECDQYFINGIIPKKEYSTKVHIWRNKMEQIFFFEIIWHKSDGLFFILYSFRTVFMYHFNECFYRNGINLRSLAESPFLFCSICFFAFYYLLKYNFCCCNSIHVSFGFGYCLMTTCGEVNNVDHLQTNQMCADLRKKSNEN